MGTIFVDLDGTLVYHNYDPVGVDDRFLPGALTKLYTWSKTHDIIITTARSESDCQDVMGWLNTLEINIKKWIFNLATGPRWLINDTKDGEMKAKAIEVQRNRGLLGVEL